MDSIKRKIMPRKLSMRDNHTDFHSFEEADEETQKQLEKDFAEADKHGWAQGRPGSFLNKLIQHGNKKTEEEFTKKENTKS